MKIAPDMNRCAYAARAAWGRWLRTGKLPAYWPELAVLTPAERDAARVAVHRVRAEYAARKAYDAGAPRHTSDGRRIS